MKKIIAAAVATAFVAPAFADVSVSGYHEFSYQDANGASSSVSDNVVTIRGTEELSNGITVSADFNFNSNSNTTIETADTIAEDTVLGNNDGGHSLTVSGTFGSVDMGDTSSAQDQIDDITEYGRVLGRGTGSGDAAVLWTLPSLMEGLNVYISHAAETNIDGNEESDGFAVRYDVANARFGFGQQDNGDGTSHGLVNAQYTMGGVTVGYEQFTDTAEGGVDTDTTNLGLRYVTGPLTIGYETSEVKDSDAAAANDFKVMSVEYAVGGGFVVGINTRDDDLVADSDVSAVYAAFTF